MKNDNLSVGIFAFFGGISFEICRIIKLFEGLPSVLRV